MSSSPPPPPTPLSTRELRDKYARKALHADSPGQTTNSLLPDGGGSAGVLRRRSPRKKPDREGGKGTDSADGERTGSFSSPPNQKFKESSPSVAGSTKPASKDVTPGMSMIARTGNGSAGRGRRSTFTVSDAEESSEGDTDDSQQPSAKVRVRPTSQSSTLTSKTGRNTSGVGKRTLNSTATAAASRRSSGSFTTDRSTSRLIEITRAEERNEACKKFVTGFGIIAVMVGFMLLIFVQYEANSLVPLSDLDAEYWNKTLKSFKDEMKVLKQEFSAQDKRAWAVISSSVRGILKEHPSQPSVLLLVSTDKTRPTSECLAMKMAQLGSGVLGKAPPSKKPSDASQFLSKADLFKRMNHELASRGAFVLSRLETLSGAVAMALHGICDNLSAPQKQAVVVMLVDVGKLPDAAEENIEAIVEKVLTKKWEEQLDIDRIGPILSRITVSVVRVKEESKNACN